MGKKADVISIDKNWWKGERTPSDAPDLVVQKKRKLPHKLFTITAMAEKLGCGRDLLYDAIKRGDLYAWVVGGQYRLGEADVDDFLALCARKKGTA